MTPRFVSLSLSLPLLSLIIREDKQKIFTLMKMSERLSMYEMGEVLFGLCNYKCAEKKEKRKRRKKRKEDEEEGRNYEKEIFS